MRRGARFGIAALAVAVVSVGVSVVMSIRGSGGAAPPLPLPPPPPTTEADGAAPCWWVSYPEAVVEIPAFFEDDRKRSATIVVTSGAATTELVGFYRGLLHDAGFVITEDRRRVGIGAVLTAQRDDGSEVRLTAVAGSMVILCEEPRLAERVPPAMGQSDSGW